MSMIIYDSLCCGKQSARSAESLVKQFGLKSTRELRHIVSAERAAGALIGSTPDGYFRPSTIEELRECWNFHRRRASTEYRTAQLFRAAIERAGGAGQMSIFDEYLIDGLGVEE